MSVAVEPTVLDWFTSSDFLKLINSFASANGLGKAFVTNHSITNRNDRTNSQTIVKDASTKTPIFRSETMISAATHYPVIVTTIEQNQHNRLTSGEWQSELDITVMSFFGLTKDEDLGMKGSLWADTLRSAFMTYCKLLQNQVIDGVEMITNTKCTVDCEGRAWTNQVDGPVVSKMTAVSGTVWVAYG